VICTGREPATDLLAPLVSNPAEEPSRWLTELSTQGIFAAGDLLAGRDRYLLRALGSGQKAACDARDYLTARKTKTSHCRRGHPLPKPQLRQKQQ
jgi:thioredoxin reductase